MLKAYSRLLDILEMIEKAVIAVSVAAMVILMMYQVILRYAFNNSNSWSEELVRYLFILSVMLGSAIAVRRNSHLQIDILLNFMSTKVKAIFTIVSTCAAIVFLGFLMRYSLMLCTTAVNTISAGVHIPMSIPYAAVPLGCVLMILACIEVILQNIEVIRNDGKEEAE